MSPVSALALEAAGQWGLFTTEQAGRIGMDGKAVSALVAAGRVLATETEDVFRFAGAPIDVMLDPLRTSWLALVPGSSWVSESEERRTETGTTQSSPT